MIVVGSYALRSQGYSVPFKDVDLIMLWEEFVMWQKAHDVPVSPTSKCSFVGRLGAKMVEVTIAAPGTTDHTLCCMAWPDVDASLLSELTGFGVLPLDWLFLLKMSHRYKKSSHFHKTRKDIEWFRQRGGRIPDRGLLLRRTKETLATPPSLNQSKQGFFQTPGITYTYDHDSLHRAVSVGPEPAYLTYKADGAEVMCDQDKWGLQPLYIRVRGVLEEALVLALERSLIPHSGVLTPDQAFQKGLEAICTTVTSGWFRQFAWEHFDLIMAEYARMKQNGFCYVSRFNEGVKEGVVTKLLA